jgi:hypothetical protein
VHFLAQVCLMSMTISNAPLSFASTICALAAVRRVDALTVKKIKAPKGLLASHRKSFSARKERATELGKGFSLNLAS